MKTLLRSVEKQTYVFDLKNPLKNDRVDFKNGQVTFVDELTLEIEVDKNTTLNQLFTILNSKKIDVLSVKTKTNKLEKLFIDITKNKQTH
jgi:ABC-2 type transport system ATP-binding protein